MIPRFQRVQCDEYAASIGTLASAVNERADAGNSRISHHNACNLLLQRYHGLKRNIDGRSCCAENEPSIFAREKCLWNLDVEHAYKTLTHFGLASELLAPRLPVGTILSADGVFETDQLATASYLRDDQFAWVGGVAGWVRGGRKHQALPDIFGGLLCAHRLTAG